MTNELRVVHIADIHWRGLARHEEYREAFGRFFKEAQAKKPDIIYVGGDIVHNKTQGISPELIDNLIWWFTSLAEIAPTHVILGNHDGIMHNKLRQDAISPIINALDNDRIFLYKDSGTYPTGVPGFNWAVFSCFDEPGWDNVSPIEDDINIALYHGAVRGSLTDINWEVDGEADISFFDEYDFTMLGDIHRPQFLNEEKTVAYCGSTIQQNYGEDMEKGFMFWKIRAKDDFDVEFCALEPVNPFVTIDWLDDVGNTLSACKKFPHGTRFRIRASDPIPQVEVKQVQNDLRELHGADEVVFKYDDNYDTNVISTKSVSLFKKDLRDPSTHLSLFKEYFGEDAHSEEEWKVIQAMLVEYIKAATRDDDIARNVKWSIDRMEFDNIFSFGAGNTIDFSKYEGITGIFAANASGKSSIVGSIMYSLFNTTDRGSIKNLHVINGRKNFCKVKTDISINSEKYRIERQTVRHENRSGIQNGITHLNFYNLKENGLVVDKTGEQRTMTEKMIRNLIGTADDFLLTSFASQGEMNRFIQEGATHRKRILTKFLDLVIFEKIFEYAKKDSSDIKAQLQSAPDSDWTSLISEKRADNKKIRKEIKGIESGLVTSRARLFDLKGKLEKLDTADLVTPADIARVEGILNSILGSIDENTIALQSKNSNMDTLSEKIKKIQNVKVQFPIEELRAEFESQNGLKDSITTVRHVYEKELLTFNSRKKSIKILDDVPCGDSFPTCKFIKNSHNDKDLLVEQKAKIAEMLTRLEALEKKLTEYVAKGTEDKIAKYEALLKRECECSNEISQLLLDIKSLKIEDRILTEKSKKLSDDLAEMRSVVTVDESGNEVSELRGLINEINSDINTRDATRISLATSLGENNAFIKKTKEEMQLYTKLRSKWNIYQSFMKAVSKKGIPAQIISSQLPIINAEIAKILNSVVDFTVEFDIHNSNRADIFINYGDTRRIIELASGMEKMISSLAIRVALLNVSSLPKPDILIIDEGFGTLDENRITACNLLLTSLKKWFKNILVITHVDGIKDVADNVIEIGKKGIDSHVLAE